MTWLKTLIMTTVISFIFGITMLNFAVAGEKTKWHGTSVTTNYQQIKVGDEEGHVMALYEAKQLYFNETTGEKMAGVAVNTMDINLKTGQGTVRGCGWRADKDGDKTIRTHEGKSLGKGHWGGTWVLVGGTGKYKGAKGGGTWDSYSMGQELPSHLEIVGEVEMVE